MRAAPPVALPGGDAVNGSRTVSCTRTCSFRAATVNDRYRLAPGARIAGSALAEERESAPAIPERAPASSNGLGHLMIALWDADGEE